MQDASGCRVVQDALDSGEVVRRAVAAEMKGRGVLTLVLFLTPRWLIEFGGLCCNRGDACPGPGQVTIVLHPESPLRNSFGGPHLSRLPSRGLGRGHGCRNPMVRFCGLLWKVEARCFISAVNSVGQARRVDARRIHALGNKGRGGARVHDAGGPTPRVSPAADAEGRRIARRAEYGVPTPCGKEPGLGAFSGAVLRPIKPYLLRARLAQERGPNRESG